MFKKQWPAYLLVLVAQGAWAQTLPSAGGQMQQVPPVPNRSDTWRLAEPPITLDAQPEVATQAQSEPKGVPAAEFILQRLQVIGATAYPESQLMQVSGFEPGAVQSLLTLQAMAERIALFYRQRSHLLTRVFVPAQIIRDGVGTLAVIEGRYGQVQLKNTSKLDSDVALDVLADLKHLDFVTLAPLEERLLLLSDIPGVQVRSTLVPGASPGLSDLVVEVLPGDRFSGSVDIDNAGNRYTGEDRVGATLNLNNPSGQGDLASLRVLTSGSGLRYGRASYQIPWGRGRVGVSYSDLGYQLGREFASLQANGHARVASLFGSLPVRRSRQSNVSLAWALETKHFQDRIDAEPSVTDKRAQVATASVYGDQRDAWGGGGLNSYSLAWSLGSIDIRTPEALERDAGNARAHGRFNKLAVALSRVQRATDSLSLYASLSGQVASKNLDVSEKMAVGGMYGVRAYPEGEAYADEGWLLTLEARQRLRLSTGVTGQVHVAAFMDASTVKLQHSPWLDTPKRRHLSGAGLGVYWTQPRDFSLKAFYARKLGHEDTLSAPEKSGRLWMQAVKYF